MTTRTTIRRFAVGAAVAILFALIFSRRVRTVAAVAVGSGVAWAAAPMVLPMGRRLLPPRRGRG